MNTLIGVAALGAAVVLAMPPVFTRVLDYFLQARRLSGLPLERRGQTIALVGWILGLLLVAFLLL